MIKRKELLRLLDDWWMTNTAPNQGALGCVSAISRKIRSGSKNISRSDFAEDWEDLWEMSIEVQTYLVPRALYFSVDRELFPMFEFTPIYAALLSPNEDSSPNKLFNSYIEAVPKQKLKILLEFYKWRCCYRVEQDDHPLLSFCSSETFKTTFGLNV